MLIYPLTPNFTVPACRDNGHFTFNTTPLIFVVGAVTVGGAAMAGRPNFDFPSIATMLGVSLRTVRRHMDEYSLTVHSCYTDIDDARLDHIVRELKEQIPNSGYRMVDGLLRQHGIRVQQLRVRESIHRTDPNGTIVRHADFIQRRKYHVPGPQSLWHIDGNHKLIRYVYVYSTGSFTLL